MKKAKITILFILLCIQCQSDKIDIVEGKDAVERISKEISTISTFESFGNPNINRTDCTSGATNTPYTITIDSEPNETYATAQSVSIQYPQFTRAQVSGNISNPADKDVYVFSSNTYLYGKFTIISGSAACKISYGANEIGNNTFFPTGINFILAQGSPFAGSQPIGSNPWEAVYIGCDGATGQNYVLQADFSTTSTSIPNPTGITGSASPALMNALTSHTIFIEAMGIKKSETYTTDSMNRCIDAIRTKGFALAIANYNRNFSLCANNRAAYEAERFVMLKEDCTLKPAKVTPNKIYGTGE